MYVLNKIIFNIFVNINFIQVKVSKGHDVHLECFNQWMPEIAVKIILTLRKIKVVHRT